MTPNRRDIPEGRSNSISKADLSRLWGCDERSVRAAIAELRTVEAEDCILSSATGRPGYWRSNSPDEISGFIRETEARGRNVFLSVRAAKRFLKKRGFVQLSLFDDVEGA